MPWINEEKCTGCGICVDKCPSGSILMKNKKAVIDMKGCIHCGTCHDACRAEAVRHDGERVPEDVKSNVEETKKIMQLCAEYFGKPIEGKKCLERMIKHWNREKLIAEKTLEELTKIT